MEMLEDCLYTYRHDGIHEFIFFVPSYQAVDFWIEKMDSIRVKNGTVGVMLMDVRDFSPSAMYYMLQKFREWRKAYPNGTGSYTAVIFPQDQEVLSVARAIAQLMILGGHATVHLFERREYEQAVEWLLKNQKKM